MSRKRKKKMQKDDKFTIVVVIITTLLMLGVFAVLYFTVPSIHNLISPETERIRREDKGDDLNSPYVTEVKYVGGIGYPEVYDYPFEKTEYYKSNKQLSKEHPDRIETILKTTNAYMDLLFNTSYRTILADEEAYINSLLEYMDENWLYETEEDSYTAEQYAQKWAEFLIDNKVEMQTNFLTDSSLVCVNGIYYVRGILEYDVFSSLYEDLPVTEEMQHCIVEVQVHRSNKVLDDMQVVYVNKFDTSIFDNDNTKD